MSITPGCKAKSILCMAAALAVLASPVNGAAPDDTDEAAITVDQTIQALKDEVVLFQRDAILAEDEYLYPPVSRVTVFVSNTIPGLLLEEFSVSIPGTQAVTHKYGENDSRALLQKATTQRLIRINLPPGTYSVNATFKGQMADAEKGDEPVTGQGQFTFRKDVQAAEIELKIIKGARRRSEPALQLVEWRALD